MPVRLHCCLGDFEVATVRRLHGRSPIQWLGDLGFLGPNALLPHGTHVDARRADSRPDDDLGLIAAAGAAVVQCPLVAARFGKALDSFAHYRARGLKIALGTDTAPADLVLNMQVGLLTCRVAEGRPEACRASDYLDAATLGGAEALGRPDLGRLAPGCRADLAVFDLRLPHHHQAIDPVQTLPLTGRGRDARTVVVDGCFAMADRVIPGVDEAAVTSEAQARFDRLVARYPDRTWRHPPVARIFPPSYPAWD